MRFEGGIFRNRLRELSFRYFWEIGKIYWDAPLPASNERITCEQLAYQFEMHRQTYVQHNILVWAEISVLLNFFCLWRFK